MTIVSYGLGDRAGAIVSYGLGSRTIPMYIIIGARYGMFFETIYEKWYIVLAYYLKRELTDLKLQSDEFVFKEVEIGDTENIEAIPGAYIFFAPTNIIENYVGPRTTTHMFTFSIMVRMPPAQSPLDLFKNIARYHGLIYNRLIGDRSMNDTTIMTLVNDELETSEEVPLCQHRAIGGWRPPVGGKAPEIFFDLAIEKRMR